MFSILAFGDSITFGSGVNPKYGWTQHLKEFFENKDDFNLFYNLGIPGDTSEDLLRRIDTEANARVQYYLEENKFIILIAIGINDSKGQGTKENIQTNPEDFQKNIEKIIQIAKTYTKHVVIIGLTPVDEEKMPFEDTYFNNERIEKYNQILKTQAEKNSLLYCEIFNSFVNKNYKELLSDGLHPNEEGFKVIYETIRDFLFEKKLI